MRQATIVLGLFCSAVLVSCSDAPTVPNLSGLRPSAEASFSRSNRGREASVTGRGVYVLTNIAGVRQALENAAILHADGSVTGEFFLRNDFDGGQMAWGRIVCLGVAGNRANLAGVIVRSNTPVAPAGNYLLWSIVDNGEGKHSAPDRVSNVFEFRDKSVAMDHCNFPIDVGTMYPVVQGNYEVREK